MATSQSSPPPVALSTSASKGPLTELWSSMVLAAVISFLVSSKSVVGCVWGEGRASLEAGQQQMLSEPMLQGMLRCCLVNAARA